MSSWPEHSPALYLMDAAADKLQASSVVHELLFPPWNDHPVASTDWRVYRATVDFSRLADGPLIAQQLPRIYVAASVSDTGWEQEDIDAASGPASLWVHCLVAKENYLHGDKLEMTVRGVLLSTPLIDARIIASGLYPVGQRREERESSFNDAWRFTSEFRVGNVGVLV